MFSITLFSLVLLIFSLVYAYPQITSPSAGAFLSGGVIFTVMWAESGDPPTIPELTSYELYLYTGSNASPQQLTRVTSGIFSSGNSISVAIPLAVGGSMTNAYFLGLVTTSADKTTITSFSNRFTLTGMTGTFSDAIRIALEQVYSSTGPGVIKNVAAPVALADSLPEEGDMWAIPYNLQFGPTKYAPMQPIPPTAITATNTEPLWPTSSVELAKTLLPIPSQLTTITQSQTFSLASHANTAAPASQPTDNMQKFLNRWRD
ncbi:Cell wall synthesis protein KNH1 [Golovinomyces cichoracearum]|uniref:Cell wall synthesis protein KNH1 n=1 Tax=Golovinomyces cichoracearum TaxID=62708 RepID=A0A420IZ17_9PEZI|nr:Cell wall synthesis protein KNH1 [Golovinomyces cichoracearum]